MHADVLQAYLHHFLVAYAKLMSNNWEQCATVFDMSDDRISLFTYDQNNQLCTKIEFISIDNEW